MATSKANPESVTLRPYNVGFGDCFLLSFHYPGGARSRHILIDFGSNRLPQNAARNHMLKVANTIKKDCGGKLDVVIATHRHKDHISGFATNKKGTAPGDVIASCKPSIVIQPWTEDPTLPADAVSPHAEAHHHFSAALSQMQQFASAVVDEMPRRAFGWSTNLISKARNNADSAKNPSARNNLNHMAPSKLYVKRGDKLDLSKELPGVKVTVLGPPTLEDGTLTYASNSKEYWLSVRNAWATQRYSQQVSKLPESIPIEARWFVNASKRVHLEETQQLVTLVDSFLNNTSVVLLFEAAGKKLLFPGDAQLENWRGVLDNEKLSQLLSDVDVYKVGHHGSRNATPKRLWEKFKYRSKDEKKKRLRTVMSTMAGVYQDTNEVPRKTLVAALKAESKLYDTETIKDVCDRDPLEL